MKARIIASMGAAELSGLANRAGIACVPVLSGLYDFAGRAQRYAQLMGRWLQDSPEGIIMCHPATLPPCHPAALAEAGDEIGAARAWEYAYLGRAVSSSKSHSLWMPPA